MLPRDARAAWHRLATAFEMERVQVRAYGSLWLATTHGLAVRASGIRSGLVDCSRRCTPRGLSWLPVCRPRHPGGCGLMANLSFATAARSIGASGAPGGPGHSRSVLVKHVCGPAGDKRLRARRQSRDGSCGMSTALPLASSRQRSLPRLHRVQSAARQRWRCTTSWRWHRSRDWCPLSTTAVMTTWTHTPSYEASSRCGTTSCRSPRMGQAHAPFKALEACGIAAEARMLEATGGVNTHRGAVFTLGLLCAAAGAARRDGEPARPATLRAALRRHWGDALQARSHRISTLPGGIAARRHGLRSASQEAALGFPVLFDTAVPTLFRSVRRGLSPEQARVDTLFAVMAVLDDSNLAHRGGIQGLRNAQQAARDFLAKGGAAGQGGMEAAHAVHRDFVALRLSPGGAADTLAAACWMQRICGVAE